MNNFNFSTSSWSGAKWGTEAWSGMTSGVNAAWRNTRKVLNGENAYDDSGHLQERNLARDTGDGGQEMGSHMGQTLGLVDGYVVEFDTQQQHASQPDLNPNISIKSHSPPVGPAGYGDAWQETRSETFQQLHLDCSSLLPPVPIEGAVEEQATPPALEKPTKKVEKLIDQPAPAEGADMKPKKKVVKSSSKSVELSSQEAHDIAVKPKKKVKTRPKESVGTEGEPKRKKRVAKTTALPTDPAPLQEPKAIQSIPTDGGKDSRINPRGEELTLNTERITNGASQCKELPNPKNITEATDELGCEVAPDPKPKKKVAKTSTENPDEGAPKPKKKALPKTQGDEEAKAIIEPKKIANATVSQNEAAHELMRSNQPPKNATEPVIRPTTTVEAQPAALEASSKDCDHQDCGSVRQRSPERKYHEHCDDWHGSTEASSRSLVPASPDAEIAHYEHCNRQHKEHEDCSRQHAPARARPEPKRKTMPKCWHNLSFAECDECDNCAHGFDYDDCDICKGMCEHYMKWDECMLCAELHASESNCNSHICSHSQVLERCSVCQEAGELGSQACEHGVRWTQCERCQETIDDKCERGQSEGENKEEVGKFVHAELVERCGVCQSASLALGPTTCPHGMINCVCPQCLKIDNEEEDAGNEEDSKASGHDRPKKRVMATEATAAFARTQDQHQEQVEAHLQRGQGAVSDSGKNRQTLQASDVLKEMQYAVPMPGPVTKPAAQLAPNTQTYAKTSYPTSLPYPLSPIDHQQPNQTLPQKQSGMQPQVSAAVSKAGKGTPYPIDHIMTMPYPVTGPASYAVPGMPHAAQPPHAQAMQLFFPPPAPVSSYSQMAPQLASRGARPTMQQHGTATALGLPTAHAPKMKQLSVPPSLDSTKLPQTQMAMPQVPPSFEGAHPPFIQGQVPVTAAFTPPNSSMVPNIAPLFGDAAPPFTISSDQEKHWVEHPAGTVVGATGVEEQPEFFASSGLPQSLRAGLQVVEPKTVAHAGIIKPAGGMMPGVEPRTVAPADPTAPILPQQNIIEPRILAPADIAQLRAVRQGMIEPQNVAPAGIPQPMAVSLLAPDPMTAAPAQVPQSIAATQGMLEPQTVAPAGMPQPIDLQQVMAEPESVAPTAAFPIQTSMTPQIPQPNASGITSQTLKAPKLKSAQRAVTKPATVKPKKVVTSNKKATGSKAAGITKIIEEAEEELVEEELEDSADEEVQQSGMGIWGQCDLPGSQMPQSYSGYHFQHNVYEEMQRQQREMQERMMRMQRGHEEESSDELEEEEQIEEEGEREEVEESEEEGSEEEEEEETMAEQHQRLMQQRQQMMMGLGGGIYGQQPQMPMGYASGQPGIGSMGYGASMMGAQRRW